MMSGQARRILGLLLVVLSFASVGMAAQTPAGEPQLIRAQSIKGAGEYSNSESLIIDGQMPPQEADWNGPQCVYWEGPQARFVIALDGVYRITGLTLQADNNDDYVVEASMDGTTFAPLLVVKGDWGEVGTGMQTLSTRQDDPHFLPAMTIKPVQAKYLRLSGRGGDEAYSVSELLIYGSKVPSDSVPPVVVTDGGTTPPVTPSGPITPKSIQGYGEFTNAAKLIIDQKIPPEETVWDDPRCVCWASPQTYFLIDLGTPYSITGLTLQVDNNDEYVIETSTDGQTFTPMVVVKGEWGEVVDGMETLSTLSADKEFCAEMVTKPRLARQVKVSARAGDEAYAVSEIRLYGAKVQTGSVPPIGGGSTPPATQSGPITPKSIQGYGKFTNAAKLIIDQKIPPEETPWDDPRCVYWTSRQTYFVIDLGDAYWITGLTLQVDLNDEYVVATSMDGKTFTPMIVIEGDWGEIGAGMETLSTIPTDPEFLPEMVLRPTQARYVKLSVRSGDDFYAVSEIRLYGGKTRLDEPPVPSVPPADGTSSSGDGQIDMAKAFDAIDANKDGRLSKEEYAAIWKEGVNVDEKFKFFDTDGNGFIERQEYLSLPARMKQGTGKQSKSGTTGPAPLDPAKVRQAIEAIPNWTRIRELVSARKMAEAAQIAKAAGFESWPALERYFVVLQTVQAALETNPEAVKDSFGRLFGPETVQIVSEPQNMEKIKTSRPQ